MSSPLECANEGKEFCLCFSWCLSSAPRTVIGIGWEQNKYSLDKLMNSAQFYSSSS